MDLEREPLQQTYRACGLGFAINGVALVLIALDSLLHSAFFVQLLWDLQLPRWVWLFEAPGYKWLVGAPIAFLSLLGTFLLWGRWNEPSWQRRAGLLVCMNLVDLIIWSTQYCEAMGFGPNYLGHQWLVICTGAALTWAELALTASLAADVWSHLGAREAEEVGTSTRALIAIATIFWFLSFFQRTNWNGGWPLEPHRWNLPTLYMFAGVLFMRTTAVIRVALLSLTAARECLGAARELEREGQTHDLLVSRSESEAEEAFALGARA